MFCQRFYKTVMLIDNINTLTWTGQFYKVHIALLTECLTHQIAYLAMSRRNNTEFFCLLISIINEDVRKVCFLQ